VDPPVSHTVSVRRGTQDTSPEVQLCVRDSHPVLSAFPNRSTSSHFLVRSPTTPTDTSVGLGCSAFARHYSQNPFFSSGYLDVSVHPVPPACAVCEVHSQGFPHSDIPGYYGCTRLTGAFRSVPRPSSALDAKASPVCPYSLLTTACLSSGDADTLTTIFRNCFPFSFLKCFLALY
jgi:hypothetical protein